jgi:hypothetical protein
MPRHRRHEVQRLRRERNALMGACKDALQRLIDNRDPETLGVWNPDADVEEELEAAIAVCRPKPRPEYADVRS